MPELIDTTPHNFQLQARPDVPPLVVALFPDWRGAPDPGTALLSVLTMMIVQQSHALALLANRVAALEVHAAEQARLQDAATDAAARERASTRSTLAIAAISQCADAIEIAPNEAQGSALDLLRLD